MSVLTSLWMLSGSWTMTPVLANSTCEKLLVDGATRSHALTTVTSRVRPIEEQVFSRGESRNPSELGKFIFIFIFHPHKPNVFLLQMGQQVGWKGSETDTLSTLVVCEHHNEVVAL